MGVYVDDMQAKFGRMIMCHMVADSTEELLEMVDKIGIDRKWIQQPGTVHEHFDIAKTKRALAIEHGAKPVSQRQLSLILKDRRLREAAAKQNSGPV